MDYYHIWCDLKDSARDLEFSDKARAWLSWLQERGLIHEFRISRRKLGFGPSELGEFHLEVATLNMAQLDEAFQRAASRDADIEPLHAAVYSLVRNARFALYRDFPDPARRSDRIGERGGSAP